MRASATLGSMPQALVGLELPDLQEALGDDQPAFRARQIYDAVYRQKVSDLVQISTLPANLRKELAARLSLGLPRQVSRVRVGGWHAALPAGAG